jgi:glucose-6-phosphate isomerase
MPGKIGDEYFLTKGHLHAWRPAAEFYFGLSGEGVMLLEDEATGESRLVPLRPHHAVYVPGHTAHRTVNTGAVPLTYLGVYPARPGTTTVLSPNEIFAASSSSAPASR